MVLIQDCSLLTRPLKSDDRQLLLLTVNFASIDRPLSFKAAYFYANDRPILHVSLWTWLFCREWRKIISELAGDFESMEKCWDDIEFVGWFTIDLMTMMKNYDDDKINKAPIRFYKGVKISESEVMSDGCLMCKGQNDEYIF